MKKITFIFAILILSVIKLHSADYISLKNVFFDVNIGINAPDARTYSSSFSEVRNGSMYLNPGNPTAAIPVLPTANPNYLYLPKQSHEESIGYKIATAFTPAISVGYEVENFGLKVSYIYYSYDAFDYIYSMINLSQPSAVYNAVFQNKSENHLVSLSPYYKFTISSSAYFTLGYSLAANIITETVALDIQGIRNDVINKINTVYWKHSLNATLMFEVSKSTHLGIGYNFGYNGKSKENSFSTNMYPDGFAIPTPNVGELKQNSNITLNKGSFIDHTFFIQFKYYVFNL